MNVKDALKVIFPVMLVGCVNTTPAPTPISNFDTLGSFNKTFWNIPDTVRVGSVIRFEKGDGNYIVAVKYSDFIADKIPSNKIELTKDMDQSVIFTDSKAFKLAVDLIKPFGGPSVKLDGTQIGANYGKDESAKLSFKDVSVQQIAHLPLLITVQDLDAQKNKDREGSELFHQINMDGRKIKENHKLAKYWIVTKVFTPKEIEWSVNEKSDKGVNFDCNFVGVKCGKLSLGGTSTGEISGKGGKVLYVVIKPFFTENGVIRIDSTIQATKSVNNS